MHPQTAEILPYQLLRYHSARTHGGGGRADPWGGSGRICKHSLRTEVLLLKVLLRVPLSPPALIWSVCVGNVLCLQTS